MLTLNSSHSSQALAWQRWDEKLQTSTTLASLVMTAWQIGRYVAQVLVEKQLHQRAQQAQSWGSCAQCTHPLQSKGWVGRRMLTLIGWVEWKRRVAGSTQVFHHSRINHPSTGNFRLFLLVHLVEGLLNFRITTMVRTPRYVRVKGYCKIARIIKLIKQLN
jgi:hypothetical protein